jgi:hypothetical protein
MKSLSRSAFWTVFAALLPLFGLSAMVLRAELAVRRGSTIRVAIRGYDPRDLLHGQYLRYQFDFDWASGDTCDETTIGDASPSDRSAVLADTRLVPGCCLCLMQHPGSTYPKVRQVPCADPRKHCTGWLRSADVQPPLRYFIPEASAAHLENALAKHQASVEIVTSRAGDLVVGSLLLDGRPWRSVFDD